MKKVIEILIGFLAGIFVSFLGSILFLFFVVKINPFENFQLVLDSGSSGRVIVVGCILNLLLFWFFLSRKQDLKAKGTILAVIFLTVLTQLI